VARTPQPPPAPAVAQEPPGARGGGNRGGAYWLAAEAGADAIGLAPMLGEVDVLGVVEVLPDSPSRPLQPPSARAAVHNTAATDIKRFVVMETPRG
jgi:hypothetical protein